MEKNSIGIGLRDFLSSPLININHRALHDTEGCILGFAKLLNAYKLAEV